MIVDDDYQIREGMRIAVDWGSLGIDEVDTCANGIEAMRIFQEKLPEIIIADIQMPGMNGLEMVRQIRSVSSEVRIIFISAYSDFEYCREALKLGANEYILKPVQINNFEEILRKNISAFMKEKQAIDQYLTAVLEREVRLVYQRCNDVSGEKICALLRDEYPFMGGRHFITLVIKPDEGIGQKEQSYWNKIGKSLQSCLFGNNEGVFLPQMDDHMIGITSGHNSGLLSLYYMNECKNKVLYWNKIYGESLGYISAGISESHDIKGFSQGYYQAIQALEYRFYRGKGSVVLFPVTPMPLEPSKKAEKMIEDFQRRLDRTGYEIIKQEIRNWYEMLKQECLKPVVLKSICLEIYGKLCRKYQLPDNRKEMNAELENCSFAESCLQILSRYIYMDIWAVLHQRSDGERKYSNTIKLTLDYVMQHYSEQITITQVAKAVEKSPNYLSSIFKKEVGISFTEYLTAFRMEKAKQQLLITNKKVKEICYEAGYTDYVYFSQQFKQRFGCSATQMRNLKEEFMEGDSSSDKAEREEYK